MNDKINSTINVLPPFKRLCMTIGELPASYLETMTYYEMLLWFTKYLSETVIPTINNNAEAVSELQELFTKLQNYVNTYFDNLDVQQEVNNKLDEMVEDGTMDIIVQNVINIYDEYNFHTQFATEYYKSTDSLYGMQGGCVLPDGSIIQCTGHNKIIKFGTDGSVLNSVTAEYGHCNGVTYCNKTNSVFITSTQNSTLGRYMIYEIDPVTLQEISSLDLSDKEFPAEPYGLVYINETEQFVWCNFWNTTSQKYFWITDENFDIITTKAVNVKVRSTSNIGRFGNYIGVQTIQSSKIMLFNYNTLDFFKEVYINELVSDTWYITEIEWFDTRNGKIYLGFIPFASTTPRNWGGGTKVIAYYDPIMNYQETGKQNTQFPPNGEYYYVDPTANLNPLRDGSENAPFRNINEALNSALRTKNITGDVAIRFKTNEENNYIAVFSMNKAYRIYKNFEGSFTSFGGIAVNEQSNVYIHGSVTLTNGNLFNLYSWVDSHLQIRGTLNCDNVIKDSNNERLILSSSASSFTSFSLNQYGMDVTNMYGEFLDLNNYRISDETVVIPNTYQQDQLKRRVRNITTDLTLDQTDNSFQLPLYSNLILFKLRFRLPIDATHKINREESFLFKPGEYFEYSYLYNTGSEEKVFAIKISLQGKVTFDNFSDVDNLRARAMTL